MSQHPKYVTPRVVKAELHPKSLNYVIITLQCGHRKELPKPIYKMYHTQKSICKVCPERGTK